MFDRFLVVCCRVGSSSLFLVGRGVSAVGVVSRLWLFSFLRFRLSLLFVVVCWCVLFVYGCCCSLRCVVLCAVVCYVLSCVCVVRVLMLLACVVVSCWL